MWSVIRDRGTQFFGGGDIQQKGKVQTSWLAGRYMEGDPAMINQNLLCYIFVTTNKVGNNKNI